MSKLRQPRKPTREEKIAMTRNGVTNPKEYLVAGTEPSAILLTHKVTGEQITIQIGKE